MKFTSSIAVLAVLAANGLVNATPIPRDTDLEIREVVDMDNQDVWARDFDDELDARDFDDEFEARDFDDEFEARDFMDLEDELEMREPFDFDEELEVRADKAAKAAKKFAKDAGEYLYSNSPALINSADRKLKAAKSLNPPGPTPAQRAHAAVAAKKGKREFLDFDEQLEARADKAAKAAKAVGEHIYSNGPALINSADQKLKAAKNLNPPGPSPAQRAHAAAAAAAKKGKRDFLDFDDELEARADKAAKAAKAIGEHIYSNSPALINSADQKLKAAKNLNPPGPSPAQRAHAAAAAAAKKGKREFLDFDYELEVRADKAAKAAKKFAKDAGEYVYSNSPALINSADRKLKAAKSLNPPGPSPAQRAHAAAAKKTKREFIDIEEYLEARADKAAKAAKKFAKDAGEYVYSNSPALINSADRKLKAAKSLNPPGPSPAQRAHAAVAAKKGKREFIDIEEYLEARADKAAKAAKKFAKDAGEYVYSNSPALINSADRKLKAAKSLNPPGPSPAQRAHAAAKKSSKK